MKSLIPNRFLFDFEFTLPYREPGPRLDGTLRDWTDAELLPPLGRLDDAPEFARVWCCWNEWGLYLACEVSGKNQPLRCDPRQFWKGDNLRLCTDMRDARSNKRATRFCQQFYFLPTGGGSKGDQPVGGTQPIHRAKEAAPPIDTKLLMVRSAVRREGYRLEAHVPVACLSGFDPLDHPRIGLYYMLEDFERGQQYLTVGDDLNWYVDPSTWATAVLART